MVNNVKLANFCDILYSLNVIFLQYVFEDLNNVFKYSKATRTKCKKTHSFYAAQIKEIKEIFLMV